MVKISETLSLVHQTMRCHEWGSCIFGVKNAKQTICKQLWWKIALMHYCQQHMAMNEETINQLKEDCCQGCCLTPRIVSCSWKLLGVEESSRDGHCQFKGCRSPTLSWFCPDLRNPWANFARTCKIPELILLGPAKTGLEWGCVIAAPWLRNLRGSAVIEH